MAEHLTDVLSSDRHTVKPWFDGRIAVAPPVVGVKNQGFPLVGGRLDFLGNSPVAALVYKRRRHYINLFVWPTRITESTEPAKSRRDGYWLVHWARDGMNFWAVSDLDGVELLRFSNLLREAP
jgi:anti-sigma factor RsiW